VQQKIVLNSHYFLESLGEEYFFDNMYEKYMDYLKSSDDDLRVKVTENVHVFIQTLGTVG
jgi:hypothetical protein